MAQKYAKDQPAGFTNRIERVAIVGASGSVGKPIAQELLKTGQHTVTALTRVDSTSLLPDGVQVARVDYDNEDSLASALAGQQFLIITLAITAAPETESKLIRAAARAGVPYVMPNSYGWDVENEELRKAIYVASDGYQRARDAAQTAGVSALIPLVCGFWYEFSLISGEPWFGFDFEKKKVTFYDDGETKINVSTWEQCGRAVAKLLSLKELPEDTNDQGPVLSNWANKPAYIDSFLVSQRDMFESWKRISGDSDEDWTIEYEPSTDRRAKGLDRLQNGDHAGFAMAMYARVLYPNGGGNHGERHGLVNELLGLPKEDLDERTAVAKTLLEKGYQYFGNRV
ncbi:hypothetical protein BDW62DRAFT_190337 [Aspergillus aurantiobrunneus]